jgi:hypothetical protein
MRWMALAAAAFDWVARNLRPLEKTRGVAREPTISPF